MTDSASAAVQVEALDHVVLDVADPARSIGWYRDRLGLEPLRVAEFERGEVFFPSVRVDAHTIIDLLPVGRPVDGSAPDRAVDHVCLVVAPGTDLAAVAASGAFEVVDGPDRRWGARGDATSLYVLDPDRHVIELRAYDA